MLLQKAFQPIMKKTCDTWIESACISVLSLANPNSSITRRGRVGVKGVVACVTKHVPIPKIMCHVSMTGSSSYSGRFGQHLAGLGRVGHSSPPPSISHRLTVGAFFPPKSAWFWTWHVWVSIRGFVKQCRLPKVLHVILMCNYKYLKTNMKLIETSLLIKNNPQIRDYSV